MSERMIAMSTTPNLASIKPSLDKLQAIERELAVSLIERDEVIRASLVALLARQHLVVLGPPGTAKSALVTELARRIYPQNGAGLRSFAYLMTEAIAVRFKARFPFRFQRRFDQGLTCPVAHHGDSQSALPLFPNHLRDS